MDLRQLRYFVAVAQEQSFTAAARRLGMTQPALSRQIRRLERELGAVLLDRGRAAVGLSVAGQTLLAGASPLLDQAEALRLSIQSAAKQHARRLHVGYMPQFLGSVLSHALTTFCQVHSDADLQLHEMSPGMQITALRRGQLDLAIIGFACAELHRDLDLLSLARVPLRAALARRHPLAAAASLELTSLRTEPFVMLDAEQFPGRAALIRDVCRRNGFTPRQGPVAGSLSALFALISSGHGVSLAPADAAGIAQATVAFVPIRSASCAITLSAAVRRGERRAAVRTFVSEIRRQALEAARREGSA